MAYVLGMVGDHGRAEDITQEVFISAMRRMRATERPIAFKPWVYEIAKNACIDEFRRTRRTKEVPLESDDDSESPARVLVSLGSSPDSALERRQQLDDLRGAFRGLSDNHHKILVLRELEGLSYTEIGRRMGMTRPVVESTLFRARRRLGQEYEEIATGQRCQQVHAVIDAGGPKAVRALGIREHRRLARHVAHCQPCRRYAWAAGVDEAVLKPPSIAKKIAALLPIPAFLRWRREGSGADGDVAGASGSHSITSLQTASQAVTQLAGPGSPVGGLGRVAAAVAAVAVAGGGVVAGISSQHTAKPPQHKLVASRSVDRQPGVAHNRPTATSASLHGAKARAATVSKTTTSGASSHGASTTFAARSATRAGPSPTQSGSTSSPSSGSTSSSDTTSKTGLLPPVPSLPKPQVPSLPKVELPPLPSVDVSSLTNTVGSTVDGALGLVKNTVGGG